MRRVTAIDWLRLMWTMGTGIGFLASLALLRELLIDVYAVSQSPYAQLDVFRNHVEGDVWTVTLVALSLLAFWLAAVVSYAGQPLLTLPLLILGAASVAAIPFHKHALRRRIFRLLRVQKPGS